MKGIRVKKREEFVSGEEFFCYFGFLGGRLVVTDYPKKEGRKKGEKKNSRSFSHFSVSFFRNV